MMVRKWSFPSCLSYGLAIAVLLLQSNCNLEGQDKPKASLTGSWKVEKMWVFGELLPQDAADREQFRFTKGEITIFETLRSKRKLEKTYDIKLNENVYPPQIDIQMFPDFTVLGIFYLDGDTLYLSLNNKSNRGRRSRSFDPKEGEEDKIYILSRQK